MNPLFFLKLNTFLVLSVYTSLFCYLVDLEAKEKLPTFIFCIILSMITAYIELYSAHRIAIFFQIQSF